MNITEGTLSTSNKMKTSSIDGWCGLSKKSNIKMSKEYPELAVKHNMSIVNKSNSWTIDETHTFNC